MHRTLTVASINAIALAGIAHAGPVMSLQFDDRIAVGFGTQETLNGSFDFDSHEAVPMTPFADWAGSAGGGIGAASGFGEMTSMITNTSIIADGSTNASAAFDDSLHAYVSALGSSSHTIGFSIDQTITFSLIASIMAQGEANAWVRVREGFSFGDIIFDSSVNNATATIDELITLGPGEYSVQFFANSSITLLDAGSQTGNSSFDAAWTVVPAAPGSLLMLGGLFAITRRRR